MKPLLLVLTLLAAPFLHAAEPASPDVQARFLAGLPVDGTALEPLTREQAWQQHATDFQKAWASVDRNQLAKIAEWMPKNAPYAYNDPSTLFYLFSGPDILYAHAFFPQATTTIMCGIEPVGGLPDVAALSIENRAESLRNLRKSLESVLSFSFFRTIAMKTDLKNTALNGTLPVMYLFLAHAGCQINNAELVWLDAAGELQRQPAKTPGAKIDFTGPSGKQQTVYYFSSDLSNDGIKNNPAFINFCRKQGQGNSFLKAASYLLHMQEFASAREFLLSRSRTLLQDDSGIPFHYLNDEGWTVSLAGNYKGPINLFKERWQNDLLEAFKTQPPVVLPFSVGYQWKPNDSSVMIARSRQVVLKAIPVEEPPQIPVARPVPEEPVIR